MTTQSRRVRGVVVAVVAAALTTLAFAGSAPAKLTGEYVRFQNCPRTDPEVQRCLFSVTTGGEVTLGSKTVPIVNPVTLQGGYSEIPDENGFVSLVAPTSGPALSKSPQPVPGGLLGLVPPENSPPLVKALVELAAENGLTGVNSTLEIAGPVSGVKLNETNLAEGLGVSLIMPLKAKLENPLLGSNCYVGSDTNPILWELRPDTTEPPPPNEPISGDPGIIEFLDGGFIVNIQGAVLVDNAWSAPKAKGCGGPLLSALIDPVVNASSGLPSPAGNNTAILENDIFETTTFAVNLNDEENP